MLHLIKLLVLGGSALYAYSLLKDEDDGEGSPSEATEEILDCSEEQPEVDSVDEDEDSWFDKDLCPYCQEYPAWDAESVKDRSGCPYFNKDLCPSCQEYNILK